MYNKKIIFRIVMKYIFMLYVFDMVDLCIIIYIFDQNLHNVTCTKNYAQHKIGRRKY
jgi:hypothetical protein